MKTRAFVTAVAVAAFAIAAAAAVNIHTAIRPADPLALAALTLLIAVAEWVHISFFHRGQRIALNAISGFASVVVIAAMPLEASVMVAAPLLMANVLRRNAPIKTIFNVTQWLIFINVGIVVLHAVAFTTNAQLLGFVLLSVVVMDLLNSLLMILLLIVTKRSRDDIVGLATGMAVTMMASLILGACLTAAYLITPWTLFLGGVLVIGLQATGRAQAAVHADRRRLQTLADATHHLSSAMDASGAIPEFLTAIVSGFEATDADLVICDSASRTELHTCSIIDGIPSHRVAHVEHPLLEVLAINTFDEPVRLDARDAPQEIREVLEFMGHQRVLAAPLIAGGGLLIGALMLFDRSGVEGFEDGEAAVATALSRELVGFLERCRLTKAIDEERRKLADIIDSTSDGIFTLRADGTVTSWNAGFASMTGRTAEEMVGTRHFDLLRPRDAAGNDLHLESWLTGDDANATADLQVINAAGATIWLACSYSRLPGVGRSGDSLVVVARNVTQARELEKLKDDFVAVVSHELRTPLVPIRGWAQTLLSRGDRLNDEQRRTAAQSILGQAQKLESLVLNILEASRIEAGHADLRDVVDMTSIASHAVEDMLAGRPDREIRFVPPAVPSQIRGSSVWAERAVANLVANAVKYSPDDEAVDVMVSVDANAGTHGEVVVAVTDRGPGIPEESFERIFARFERLEETRKQTGTGLGLYITRRFARAMGGDVTVSSVPGAGSTFLLRLPLLVSTPEVSSHDKSRTRDVRPSITVR